jgi:undecaprenyl-diphosphatase
MPFLSRFNRNYFRRLSIGAVLMILLFAGTLALFVFLWHEVIGQGEEEFDYTIMRYVSQHVVDARFTPFMKGVTWFASSTFLQIGYGLLIASYLLRKNWRRALEAGVIGLGGFLINYVMKLTFQRQRPPDPLIERLNNFSFPSGHATSAFIFYGLLSYLLWKTGLPRGGKILMATVLIGFSLLIGFSRVYLRVHYPTDVIAGFCIGFSWLLICLQIFNVQKKEAAKDTAGTQGPESGHKQPAVD